MEKSVEITEVKIYLVNEGKLKAYATIVIQNCFIIRDLKVIRSDKGFFVSMPSRRRKDGSFKDIAHPLDAETRKQVEKRVLGEYTKAVTDIPLPHQIPAIPVDQQQS